MRILSLVCVAALSVALTGGALAFDASAPDDSSAATAAGSAANPGKTPAGDPAVRTARAIECSQKADAQDLHGKPRKHFMRACKRGE